MAKFGKTTISDVVGWLAGTGLVLHALFFRASNPFATTIDWNRIEFYLGVALFLLVSWARKTRNEVIEDIEEVYGPADGNAPPAEPEVVSPPNPGAENPYRTDASSSGVFRTRKRTSGGPAVAGFNWYFGSRALSVVGLVWAMVAYYVTSDPRIPWFIVLLISPGSVLAPHSVPRFRETVAYPSAPTLLINIAYYGAVIWLLFFRRKA
jgi:hypothetical protein